MGALYIASKNAILSRNQLLGHAWWFKIQLHEYLLQGGTIFGGESEICRGNGIISSDQWTIFKQNLDKA